MLYIASYDLGPWPRSLKKLKAQSKQYACYPLPFFLSKMSMNLSASFLKPSVAADEKPILAVKIFPLPADAQPASKHLALVIDTSGSMGGERLEAVQRTLHLLIDALPLGDKLSLIQYNSDSTIALNGSTISVDRAPIHAVVDSLVADNGTNLEAGIGQLTNLMATATVDSVFLLTDGHINEGITSSSGLLRILGSSSVQLPPLNTLGYGADYNGRTLKQLSVSTRGSHTFADAAELIPAIIGDIVGGLKSEVGKHGKLTIPEGWRCLELGYEEGDSTYNVGTLIAEKEQWVVLEGPPGATLKEELSFSWTTTLINISEFPVDTSVSKQEVSEQLNRTRVACVFGQVTDMLEAGNVQEAKAALTALIAELSSSPSKDRPFVIRLLAQVDEMLEELTKPTGFAYYGRQNAISADLVPRMTSNLVALGVQRGIVSRLQSVQPPSHDEGPPPPNAVGRALTGVYDTFSSPSQRLVSATMSNHYSQQVEEETSAPPPSPVRFAPSLPIPARV